jgi:hypothetical protein
MKDLITERYLAYGKANRQYIFAYGSDLNSQQIQKRCIAPETVCVARLEGHRLSFHGENLFWGGGTETVIEAPSDEVWGVVYSLSFIDSLRLDNWYNVRLDGAGAFFHYPVEVSDLNGNFHTVSLYKKDILGAEVPPAAAYLDFIIKGAMECALPDTYTDRLKKIKTSSSFTQGPDFSRMPWPNTGRNYQILGLSKHVHLWPLKQKKSTNNI